MKFSIKDFFSKYEVAEEIFNGKLHFLCSVTYLQNKEIKQNWLGLENLICVIFDLYQKKGD